MRGMGIVVSQARGGSKGTRVAERLGPVRGWIARRIVRERWPISGHERAVRFARIERLVIWFLVGLLAAHVLDEPAWRWARLRDEAWLEDRDWYQVLRQMGYLPVWIVLGVAYGLQDLWRRRRGGRDCGPRSVMLILSPLIAGVIAEVLKRTIGRERPPEFPVMTEADPLPEMPDLGYVFKPLLGGWSDDHNMGVPSSHAAVAFGGLVMLGLMHRGARAIFWGLALGCGASRVIAGAHWVSDVYVAAVIGIASAWAIWARMGRRWSDEASDRWASRGGGIG